MGMDRGADHQVSRIFRQSNIISETSPMLRGLLFALIIAGAGCNAQPAKSNKGTLAISVLTAQNPFFNVISDTFKAEAEKAGYTVIAVSGDMDAAKQHNQVKDFIVQKAQAIVLCPCDKQAVGAAIREANAAGIPVFTADLACLDPNAKVVTHVATDNFAGGKEAAAAMIEALSGQGGKVAILNYQEAESCLQRVAGFKDAIADHNKAHPASPIVVAAEVPCGGDRARGFNAMQTVLTGHPDVVGVFAINDPAALGAVAALDLAKRSGQIKIIGFDGQPDGKKAIREGKIYADPIQYPDKIARVTFENIQKYLAGEKTPPEILIPTGLYRKADAEKDMK